MGDIRFTKSEFSQHLADQKLMGAECTSCGSQYLPPRPICPSCFSSELRWVDMGTRGTLAAFTTVHIATTRMIEAGYGRENPHCSGIVQLENGLSISAQILGVDTADPTSIKIGSALEAVFLAQGEGDQQETVLAFKVLD